MSALHLANVYHFRNKWHEGDAHAHDIVLLALQHCPHAHVARALGLTVSILHQRLRQATPNTTRYAPALHALGFKRSFVERCTSSPKTKGGLHDR